MANRDGSTLVHIWFRMSPRAAMVSVLHLCQW